MRASCKASYIDRSFIGGLTRATAAAVLVAVLLLAQVTLASAGTLVPAADAGGPGGGGESVTDMLRGSYSPVDITLEIAVTEVEAPLTDWLREAYDLEDALARKPAARKSTRRRR